MKFKIYLSLSLMGAILSTAVKAENVYLDQFQQIQDVELFELQIDEDGNEIEILLQSNRVPSFFDFLSKSQGIQKVNAAGVS